MRQPLAQRPHLTLALIAMVIGLVLAWQLKGPPASPPLGYAPGNPRDRSVRAIEQLEAEQAAAETERLQRLNTELDAHSARTRYPYFFIAIGDPATLEAALLQPGGLLTVFSNSREGLRVSVQKREWLVAPAHTLVGMPQYAAAVK